MKKVFSFISAITISFSSISAALTYAADTSEYGTVTVTVIDSETNKLFRQDMDFSIIGGPKIEGEGVGGAIYLGGWNTSECNPYTNSNALTDFNYFIREVGKSCNGYSYKIDAEKCKDSFDFGDSNEKNIIIYIGKYWFGEPTVYDFDEVLNMDEQAFSQFCRLNELTYRTPEEIDEQIKINADEKIMLTPDKYLKEGVEDITSSENLSDINKTNQNDYDFSGVMADFGLPEKYYTCEVNTQGFMVTNRADTISDSGKLISTFYKLAEVTINVKDEYKSSDEFIRLTQMKYAMPMLDDSFDSLRFVAPNGPSVAPVVEGDVNSDGAFGIADVVLVEKWLLGNNIELKNWQAADLCKDSRLNVFDLCIMKNNLLKAE